jgi:hypothetical protein
MSRANGTGPVLLVSTPLEERLELLEEQAWEIARWAGENAPSVLSIRLCVSELRLAMDEAREVWRDTAEAARLSGWSVDTLLRYARMREASEALPVGWRGIQVRRNPSGYLFRVSSLPAKPALRRSA